MNKITLIGRITKEPELKYLPNSETAVVNITLAVDRRFKKDNETTADFIPVVIFGKQAESLVQYVDKGKKIAIVGRLQTRSYDHKDGYKVYITEVYAEEVEFIEWASGGKASSGNSDMNPIEDDDIPF